jgi:hypothetical protein
MYGSRVVWRWDRSGKANGGLAQIDRLRDIEVKRGARGNADVEGVLVEPLQKTLGVHLASGLQSRGEGAVDAAIVELRRAAKGRDKRGGFRESASARGNHRGKDGLGFGIFVELHDKSAQACGAVRFRPGVRLLRVGCIIEHRPGDGKFPAVLKDQEPLAVRTDARSAPRKGRAASVADGA